MTVGRAPGKVILFGEHAVVYGRPAIAVPIQQVSAEAEVTDWPEGAAGEVLIEAPDVESRVLLSRARQEDPLARIVRLTLAEVPTTGRQALRLVVRSSIPMASGLGSGAAVSVAVIRALSAHLGHPLLPERQSELAFEGEKLHHGTPSGIDNTVVTFNRPVYFRRGGTPQTLLIQRPFHLVIGDTGHPSPTSVAVGRVRDQWQASRPETEAIFDEIAEVVERARESIAGDPDQLGGLMDENQALLEQLGVSSPELDRLLAAARKAGAAGAKLSGAGLGGNMIAFTAAADMGAVASALHQAGAVGTIATEVAP